MLPRFAEIYFSRWTVTKFGFRQSPIRVFMDDLTVTTTSLPGAAGSWGAWRSLSPSLEVKKGKAINKFRFHHPLLKKQWKTWARCLTAAWGTSVLSSNQARAESLASCSGQVKPTMQVQEMHIPTWLLPTDSPASLVLWRPVNSTVEGFERRLSRFV